ncbi:hypothetical protein DSC45_15105 [Streptomyces sp. YIM 130001]|nr:hypothetical protein DSC45_15105 [Streptomyces sp. YIM 130001]
MSSPDAVTQATPEAGSLIDTEQAEAALVEHYPRLVRLGYLVLPPSLGRSRRVLRAHALVQRALPRGRGPTRMPDVPGQRGGRGAGGGPGYAFLRGRVLRAALARRSAGLFGRAAFAPLLPRVWGLSLFPRSGGAAELALDQELSALSAPGRAAYVLRTLEQLPDADVRRALVAAGVADPRGALVEADAVAPCGRTAAELLGSPEFDACSLQARPTDLLRRRRHWTAALVSLVAAAVCGTLLGLPADGWGGGDAPAGYADNPAVEAALDPARLTRAGTGDWERSARRDFTVWPARGELTGDKNLLGRALTAWARPGDAVRVSHTPGTATGPPPGPAQLLYAGKLGRSRVVILHDGLRIARYAEPRDGGGDAALDFARVDHAEEGSASAVIVGRGSDKVRYLTAPWVRTAAVRDLLEPAGDARTLQVSEQGVTEALASPVQQRDCKSWTALEVREAGATRLLTDLGELTPARLTSGRPEDPGEVSGTAARQQWSRAACHLTAVRSHGVRSVNSWAYATQRLPEANGSATWVCTRAETWRGTGSRTLAQFQAPGDGAAAIAAKAQDSPACGPRQPRVLAGVLWKSRAGSWYVLAGGSRQLATVTARGDARGSARGGLLAVRTEKGATASLRGTLEDGSAIAALG